MPTMTKVIGEGQQERKGALVEKKRKREEV